VADGRNGDGEVLIHRPRTVFRFYFLFHLRDFSF
jgi:hypothetical protein